MNRSRTRVRPRQQAFKRRVRKFASLFESWRQHEGEYNNPELLIDARPARWVIMHDTIPMTSKSKSCSSCRDRRSRPSSIMCILTALLLAALSAQAQQPNYDFIISGARIVDGTGAAWHYGDIAIKGDRIAAMGDLD